MTQPAQTPQWQPSNPVETRLAEALGKDDRAAYFTILMGAPLFLPQNVVDPDTATGANSEDYVTFVSDEVTYLLAFTSLETLRNSLGDAANGYVESDYETLREGLSGTGVQIGFNYGTPIDAWLDAESVARAAAGEIEVPTGAEMTELLKLTDPANAEVVDEAAQQELDAFVDEYLTRIVSGDVLVESQNGAWRIAPIDGVPSLRAFSDAEHAAGVATASVPFMQLVAKWPQGAEQLAVNQGTPLEFMLPAELIGAFSQHAQILLPPADAD